MRKIVTKLFVFVIAFLASQGVIAQNVLYEETFAESLGDFTVEGDNGINNNIWTWEDQCARGDAFQKFEGTATIENYFVSPQIILGTENTITFDYSCMFFYDLAEKIGVFVRESGSKEWTKLEANMLHDEDIANVGDVIVPSQFDGKTVQFGFSYAANYQAVGIFKIKNFKVMGNGDVTQKDDAEISYNVTEYAYTIGDEFVAPVLSNPNNLGIVFSSSDETVATITQEGVVTVLAEGVTTIKAVSEETDKYRKGEASYLLKVSALGSAEVIFEESFENNLGEFIVEGENGPKNDVWSYYGLKKCAMADAYDKVSGPIENRLVSPNIKIGTENVVTFNYVAMAFSDFLNEVAFSVREVGGSWTDIKLTQYVPKEMCTAEIAIPAEFNDKNVQFGFKYTAKDGSLCGIWEIQNFVVKGKVGHAGKENPNISFPVSDVEAILGEPFDAPVLNNPNGVEVVYSSKKPEVATVDPATGALTLVGEGFATITATSVENDKYYSASVNYVVTVKPAVAKDIFFNETFETGMGEFKTEGNNGESDNIWAYGGGCAKADAYGKVTGPNTVYLVSPEITLRQVNIASFEYTAEYFAPEVMKEEMVFSIKEVGGEWADLEIPVCKSTSMYVSSGDIVIPEAYNGKKVQIGFKYSCQSGPSSGIWKIKNFVLREKASKADPEISFDVTEVNYTIGNEFTAPVLNNPNGVEVTYSSSNTAVATVDASTGEVTVIGEGSTEIKAVSIENDKFVAAEAAYILNVKQASAGYVIFEESFATDLGQFTVEGDISFDQKIWSWFEEEKCALGDAYGRIPKVEPCTTYLISPEMTLSANGNYANFEHCGQYFEGMNDCVKFAVREIGGEWTELDIPTCNNDGQFTASGDINIPEKFNGKKVQVAFRYYSPGSYSSGYWFIKNLVVMGMSSAEKIDPQLSFPEAEYMYLFGPDKFVAPALNNPYGVEVFYSVDNYDVADVDPYTGEVWVYNYGTVVITASSEENDQYMAGSASYTLIVTDEIPTGIEGITAEDLKNGKVFDMQGRRVETLGRGVYIVNGKKVIIK